MITFLKTVQGEDIDTTGYKVSFAEFTQGKGKPGNQFLEYVIEIL